MSNEPIIDALDSASMRGEIHLPREFIEIIVEGANGELQAFTARECSKIVRFAKSCTLPVRITKTKYNAGSGMTFKYRTNKRRPCLVPDKPKDEVWFFEGVPQDKKERIEAVKRLMRQGLKPVLIAGLLGITVSNVYKHAKGEVDGTACKPSTVAVQGCA